MRTRSRTGRHHGILLGLLLAVALASPDARAENVVYHSPNDDGANPGVVYDLPVGPGDFLFLYLDAGSLASQSGTTACSDGDGREICGYEVVIEAAGSAFFVDFIPEPNVVYQLTNDQARINGIFALNPVLGAVKIGELKAASSDENGAVVMKTGKVVLAALQVESVPQMMLASVPEPLGPWPLMAGVASLAGLGRYRARRSRGRAREACRAG